MLGGESGARRGESAARCAGDGNADTDGDTADGEAVATRGESAAKCARDGDADADGDTADGEAAAIVVIAAWPARCVRCVAACG